MRRRLGALLSALVLLAGCATPPAPTPGTPAPLTGRMLVRIDSQPPRSVSAQFELSGTPAAGTLVLSGPLGATAARAEWSGSQATLQTGDRRSSYADLESLAEEALGERVPIAALFDWLRGRPWSGAPSTPRRDGTPGFEQLGWRISLVRWSEGSMEAERSTAPAVLVRARLDDPR